MSGGEGLRNGMGFWGDLGGFWVAGLTASLRSRLGERRSGMKVGVWVGGGACVWGRGKGFGRSCPRPGWDFRKK